MAVLRSARDHHSIEQALDYSTNESQAEVPRSRCAGCGIRILVRLRARGGRCGRGFAEHYRQFQDALEQQPAELIEARNRLQQQRDELRDEQNQLADWMAERDERLRLWEDELRRDAEAVNTREAAWREIRDHWMHEKLEAETIIRDLLRQLAEVGDAAAEVGGALAKRRVGQGADTVLECRDLRDDRLEPLQVAVVLSAEDLGEEVTDHAGLERARRF